MPRLTPPPLIGVFDSGVGGLSVLAPLREVIPHARFLYACDAANAPYGDRDDGFIVERTRAFVQRLHSAGADLFVVACNTATAAAIDMLRTAHPDRPIVGIEPAVKPAAALTRNGHVGVMATESTLRSLRMRRLIERHGSGMTLHLQPCPGLADAIETLDADAPALRDAVRHHCAGLRAAGCDVVVLGCTHYPLVAPLIGEALGTHVQLLDPARAVARRAGALLPQGAAQREAPQPATIELWTTGEPNRLAALAARVLGASVPALRIAL
jgi:glutamate racemase